MLDQLNTALLLYMETPKLHVFDSVQEDAFQLLRATYPEFKQSDMYKKAKGMCFNLWLIFTMFIQGQKRRKVVQAGIELLNKKTSLRGSNLKSAKERHKNFRISYKKRGE